MIIICSEWVWNEAWLKLVTAYACCNVQCTFVFLKHLFCQAFEHLDAILSLLVISNSVLYIFFYCSTIIMCPLTSESEMIFCPYALHHLSCKMGAQLFFSRYFPIHLFLRSHHFDRITHTLRFVIQMANEICGPLFECVCVRENISANLIWHSAYAKWEMRKRKKKKESLLLMQIGHRIENRKYKKNYSTSTTIRSCAQDGQSVSPSVIVVFMQ